MQEKPSELPAE